MFLWFWTTVMSSCDEFALQKEVNTTAYRHMQRKRFFKGSKFYSHKIDLCNWYPSHPFWLHEGSLYQGRHESFVSKTRYKQQHHQHWQNVIDFTVFLFFFCLYVEIKCILYWTFSLLHSAISHPLYCTTYFVAGIFSMARLKTIPSCRYTEDFFVFSWFAIKWNMCLF